MGVKRIENWSCDSSALSALSASAAWTVGSVVVGASGRTIDCSGAVGVRSVEASAGGGEADEDVLGVCCWLVNWLCELGWDGRSSEPSSLRLSLLRDSLEDLISTSFAGTEMSGISAIDEEATESDFEKSMVERI